MRPPPNPGRLGPRVAVVGGGLAGLAATTELLRLGNHVCLFEASARLGGQVDTEVVDGYVVEHGAEGFPLSRDAVAVLRQLELTDRPISQTVTSTLLWGEGRLIRLPSRAAAHLLGSEVPSGAHRGSGLSTFRDGLGIVVSRLVDRLQGRCEIRTAESVVAIDRAGQGWIVETQEHNHYAADAVVIAVPPRAAGRLLRPFLAPFADLLDAVPLVSSVSVALAFPRSAIAHALDATGFVVGTGAHLQTGEGLIACTFASSKFPGRAPTGHVLLRGFYRPGDTLPLEQPDDAWIPRAEADLGPVLGLRAGAERSWVRRWPAAIPRYRADHPERAHELGEQLRRVGPIEIAGAASSGVGVLAALESGVRAARRLLLRPGREP